MSKLLHSDGYFPFAVHSRYFSLEDSAWRDVQEWDGETFHSDSGLASSSETEWTPSTGVGTFYPIGLSLEEATRWLWRVKRWMWDISGDIFTPEAGDGEEYVPEASLSFNEHYSNSVVASYLHLVTDVGAGGTTRGTAGHPGPSPQVEIRFSADLWIGAPPLDDTAPGLGSILLPLLSMASIPRMVKREGLYYPLLLAQFEMSAAGEDFGVLGGLSFATFEGWESNFDLFIVDKQLPFYAYGSPWSVDGNTGTVSIGDIVIDKYFTYGGIYDETTGNRV